MPLSEDRAKRLHEVAMQRQTNFTVILENIVDTHNIGAVMRSCEAVGMAEIFVAQTHPQLQEQYMSLGRKTSAGTRKWLDVQYFTDLEACFATVRSRYSTILATHLDAEAKSLYDLDLTGSIALLFGNEHDGVSEEALALTDGNFIIPTMGMVQSLNISVACAVSVFEGARQRRIKGFYSPETNPTPMADREILLATYLERHDKRPSVMKWYAQNLNKGEE